MENSFKSFIDSAHSIIVLLPKGPYFDQVAAGLSMYLALSSYKKDVSINSSDPMTVEFNRLIGVNKIGNELGNKNLIIKFDNYDANGIEKVSYDIDRGQFVLTVIPKTSVVAPTTDQVNLSYAGVSADAAILIGGTRENHFPELATKELKDLPVAHVGVKQLVVESKQVMSFVGRSATVSEVATSLIAELGLAFDQDIATNLLAGIEVGTNGFDREHSTPETFMIVAELMKSGGKRGAGHQPTPATQPGSKPLTQAKSQPSLGQPRQGQPRQFSDNQIRQGNSQAQRPPMPTQVPEDLVTGQDDFTQEEIPENWLQNPKVYKGTGN